MHLRQTLPYLCPKIPALYFMIGYTSPSVSIGFNGTLMGNLVEFICLFAKVNFSEMIWMVNKTSTADIGESFFAEREISHSENPANPYIRVL